MNAREYPELAELMNNWFHQDFDLHGDTVAKVIAGYRSVTALSKRDVLRKEITALLETTAPGELEEQFESAFDLQIIPAQLSGSARAFLEEILDSL